MKVYFGRRVQGDELKPYLTELDPAIDCRGNDETFDIILFKYGLRNLEKDLTDGLEEELKKGDFETTRLRWDRIWVAGQHPFYLNFRGSTIGEWNEKKINDFERHWWVNEREKIGERKVEGWVRTKVIPMYREIPTFVSVEGIVTYEKLEYLDPVSLLKVLCDLNYNVKVEPTSVELTNLLEKMSQRHLPQQTKRRRSRVNNGCDEENLLVAGLVGAAAVDCFDDD